jgi:hypothetical protein
MLIITRAHGLHNALISLCDMVMRHLCVPVKEFPSISRDFLYESNGYDWVPEGPLPHMCGGDIETCMSTGRDCPRPILTTN